MQRHCVDLGESFPTNIYLQNLASIQPRTSLKFARSPCTDPSGRGDQSLPKHIIDATAAVSLLRPRRDHEEFDASDDETASEELLHGG